MLPLFPRSWRPSGPLLGLAALLLLFTLLLGWQGRLGTFFSTANVLQLLHRGSIPAMAVLGVLLVIVSGGIDLSLASIMALVAVVTMQTYRLVYNGPEAGLPLLLVDRLREGDWLWSGTESPLAASLAALAAGLATGTLCGLANGLLITRLRLTPFVVTLGMLSVARGLAEWLSNRTQISFIGGRPDWVAALGRVQSPLGLNPGVWLVLLTAAVVAAVLRFTVFGRYVYAVGANEQTARYCGIDVDRVKVRVYALSGLLSGVAGVLLFAHGNGADPKGATGQELEVIAAAVIGGASLSGGVGTVGGALLGVLILGVLENGVTQCNVPPEVKHVLIGVIVVVNTALAAWQKRRGEGQGGYDKNPAERPREGPSSGAGTEKRPE